MTVGLKLQIKEIIAAQALCDVADIDDALTLEALGLDSLGLVETIFAIEETFDIQVPFNANDKIPANFDLTSVDTIMTAVIKLIDEKRAA